jgi:hypothetical protein
MDHMDGVKKALFGLGIFLWSAVGGIIILMNVDSLWPGLLHTASASEIRNVGEAPATAKLVSDLSTPDSLVFAAEAKMPTYGWQVCRNLGVGSVSGISGQHARFALCTAKGWVVYTYCLQPELPNPPINRFCSAVNGDRFWCGDKVQLLKRYQIIDSPPKPTRTRTRVPTRTPTATFTPTFTNTPDEGHGGPPDEPPTITATSRPNPGGDSYLNPLSSLFLYTALFLFLSGGAAIFIAKK